MGIKSQRFAYHVDARPELAPGEGHQPCAQSPGSPGSGTLGDFQTHVPLHDPGEISKSIVKFRHNLGRCPLLRAVYRRCSGRAAQGVCNVGSADERGAGDPVVQPRNIDTLQPSQRRAAVGQRNPVSVKEGRAKGGCHSRTGVVGGAAAEAHDDAVETPVQRLADDLAGAPRGGNPGVPASGRDQCQSRRLGHLDDRGLTVSHRSPSGLQRLPQWSGDDFAEHLTAAAAHQGVYGAVTAVGDRGQYSLRVR